MTPEETERDRAPERIWIDDARTYSATSFSAGIKYIRAELAEAEVQRLTRERDAALAGAGLVEIDLAKSEKQNHPDIKTDGTLYLAKISGGWFLGRFSKQWYGLSFNNWGNAGCQFDAPGTNASRWERLIDCSRAVLENRND